MARMLVFALVIVICLPLRAQQFSVSLGVYSGVAGSFTSDKGIENDPRYEGRFETKLVPIGVNLGIDYEGFGLMISPGIINVGQNFYVVNTQRGQEGLREIDLRYLSVPVSFKLNLVRFYAFRLSAVASIAPSFLMDGNEALSHRPSKLTFPSEVYPMLPSNYQIEYDGVLAPQVDHYVISQKKDFRPVQLFAGAGFRTDWDPSNHWRISLDLRLNYGVFDSRSGTYLKNLESTVGLYEIATERRDIFAQFTIGISRYIEFDKSEHERSKKIKGSSKRFKPSQYPGQRVRVGKPKD
jgi:Outer membrane protein beta-barrel domain